MSGSSVPDLREYKTYYRQFGYINVVKYKSNVNILCSEDPKRK